MCFSCSEGLFCKADRQFCSKDQSLRIHSVVRHSNCFTGVMKCYFTPKYSVVWFVQVIMLLASQLCPADEFSDLSSQAFSRLRTSRVQVVCQQEFDVHICSPLVLYVLSSAISDN